MKNRVFLLRKRAGLGSPRTPVLLSHKLTGQLWEPKIQCLGGLQGPEGSPLYLQPLPIEKAVSSDPTHIMGHFLTQVGFHQEDLDDFLTRPMQDSGYQRVLTIF